MKMSLGEIAKAVNGKLLGDPKKVVKGISTDSRSLKRGDLFIALKGENHDGHDHVNTVLKMGAAGVIVDRALNLAQFKNGSHIRVSDTLQALGDLAKAWREKFKIPFVAITGSNGKTTTKDMVAAVLAQKFRVLKTEGNFNNLVGLPKTLLKLEKKHQVAVIEMGMNHLGEIDRLAEITSPQVGVITNIARAHLEGLKTLARVAQAKGELLPHVSRYAVLNSDQQFFEELKKKTKARIFSVGTKGKLKISSSVIQDLKGCSFVTQEQGLSKTPYRVNLPGEHNAVNALYAIAVGKIFKVPTSKIQKALREFQPTAKRMEILKIGQGIHVINDCYNANPDSMKASLEFLSSVSKERRPVAILGDMFELGPSRAALHREIGSFAKNQKIPVLVGIGKESRALVAAYRKNNSHSKSYWFLNVSAALPQISKMIQPNDLVLVKGSRGMKMEQITESLMVRD